MRRRRIHSGLRKLVLSQSQGRCSYCLSPISHIGGLYEIDHIIPAGGVDALLTSFAPDGNALIGARSPIGESPTRVERKIEDALVDADVVMILRVQRERQTDAFVPSMREYAVHYGLQLRHLNLAAPDAIAMHPGPMNRGIEISSEIADGGRSLILEQVTNGVAVRMAVLYLLAGGAPKNGNGSRKGRRGKTDN